MADKDTREAFGPDGEVTPFPETPRSEGGPATREPEGHAARLPDQPEDAGSVAPGVRVQPGDVPPAPSDDRASESDLPEADAYGGAAAPDGDVADALDAVAATDAPASQPADAAPFTERDGGDAGPVPLVSAPAEEAPVAPRSDAADAPEAVAVADLPVPQPADATSFAESVGGEAEPVPVAPAPVDPGPAVELSIWPDLPDVADRDADALPPYPGAERMPDAGVGPAEDGVETPQTDAWRSAIADAIAEPAPVPPRIDVDAATAESVAPPEAADRPRLPEGAPHGEGVPRLGAAVEDDRSLASFTAAAEDLFRPAEAKEEPHLITLGRRLDPALRIPRPQPPGGAPSLPDAEARRRTSWRTSRPWAAYLGTAGRYALYAVLGYLALVLVLIVLFRFVNPPGSMLMLTQFLSGTAIDRRWVPLGAISPHLVRAVIVSEDGRFCEHSGVDTAAIKEAIERAARGTPRGASTISMQLTKNLFLWNAKSYVRKVIEIPLTLLMELVWPKWRVLEVYLNIAEWGPGIFGAEAAAQRHFDKPAARLSEREAALLASVLPNPVVRDASAPGPRTSAKARVVQARVKAYGAVASCVVPAAAAAPRPPAAAVPAVRPRPARKTAPSKAAPGKATPVRKKPQQPAPASDAWEPTLNFGPR